MLDEVFNHLLNTVPFDCRLTKSPNGDIWLREKGVEEATVAIRSSSMSPNDLWSSSFNQGKGHLVVIDCVSDGPRKELRQSDPKQCAHLALVMYDCIIESR